MYSPAGTATARRPDGGPRIACASACRASWTRGWPSATGDEPPSSTGGHVDTLTAAPPVSLSSSSGASGAVAFAVPVLNRAAAAPKSPPPQPSCGALRTIGAVVVPCSSSPRLPQTRDTRTSSTPSRHGDGVVVTCTPVVAEWIREPSVESRRPQRNGQWPVSGGKQEGPPTGHSRAGAEALTSRRRSQLLYGGSNAFRNRRASRTGVSTRTTRRHALALAGQRRGMRADP